MMGDDNIDPGLRDKLIETHTDMKHVRRMIEQHGDVIEEVRNQHDERIRKLEQTQGKILTYIVVIGSVITVAMNAVMQGGMYVIEKIWK